MEERPSPAWLAERPLVVNDGSTQMHRLTAAWFAQAGHHPRARIELNYTEAMKSLVAAGYGALFGWILFGVYDFTNYSTLKNYPLIFAVVDTLWGGVAGATTATIVAGLTRRQPTA